MCDVLDLFLWDNLMMSFIEAAPDVLKGWTHIFVTCSCSGHCQWDGYSKRGTFSFHAVAACIKATRWWQCCCGQNLIPPAVSASSLELQALMQSWLTQWEAAFSTQMVLDLSWLSMTSLERNVADYWERNLTNECPVTLEKLSQGKEKKP